jgi:hypothetical protein
MGCAGFQNENITLIQKNINDGPSYVNKTGSRVQTLIVPNHGFECSSYMQYIADNYDHLADYVFFLQGAPFEHCGGLERAIHNPRLYEKDFYMFSWFNYHIRKSGWPHFWPHQGMGRAIEKVHRRLFGGEPPEYLQTYFNGQFMVSKQTIRRHPKEFYESIVDLLQNDRDPRGQSWGKAGDGWLECGALERMWQKVFLGVDKLAPYPPADSFC